MYSLCNPGHLQETPYPQVAEKQGGQAAHPALQGGKRTGSGEDDRHWRKGKRAGRGEGDRHWRKGLRGLARTTPCRAGKAAEERALPSQARRTSPPNRRSGHLRVLPASPPRHPPKSSVHPSAKTPCSFRSPPSRPADTHPGLSNVTFLKPRTEGAGEGGARKRLWFLPVGSGRSPGGERRGPGGWLQQQQHPESPARDPPSHFAHRSRPALSAPGCAGRYGRPAEGAGALGPKAASGALGGFGTLGAVENGRCPWGKEGGRPAGTAHSLPALWWLAAAGVTQGWGVAEGRDWRLGPGAPPPRRGWTVTPRRERRVREGGSCVRELRGGCRPSVLPTRSVIPDPTRDP